mgnify:CR=1 FL=1
MNAIAQTNVGKNVLAFAFAIGQRVSIEAIDTKGIVQAITITSEGIEYRVAYFDDDKVRRVEWLGSSEISRITG